MPRLEAAVGDEVQACGRHRQQRRRADVDGKHARGQFDRRGLGGQIAQLADGVVRVRLGDQRRCRCRHFSSSTTLVDGLVEAARVIQGRCLSASSTLYHQPVGWPCVSYLSSATNFSSGVTGGASGSMRDGLGQLHVGIGEVAIGLVAGQREQQIAGQQRPNRSSASCDPDPASPTAGVSRRPSASPPAWALLTMRSVAASQARHSSMALERNVLRNAGCAEDQAGHFQRRGRLLGRRVGDRREQRGHRFGLDLHSRRGEHRRRAAEAMTDHAELGRDAR